MSTITIPISETAHQILRELAEQSGQSMTEVLEKALDAYRHALMGGLDPEEFGMNNVIHLSPEGQLAFWKALNEPVHLTEAQKRLGKLMRGES